jgi:CheY-like chemotaxis protein
MMPAPASGLTVLVVDDHASAREVISRLLEAEG